LNSFAWIKQCYLGGGTALALQLGHRKSEDLDFFTGKNIEEIFYPIKQYMKDTDIAVINQSSRHIELMIQSIKVDLITLPISLKFPLKSIRAELENIMIVDPKDIGRMKIISIGSRGCKKDFIDLYCLTRKTIFLDELIKMAIKEGHGFNYSKLLFLKGLVDFTEADKEPDPVMVWDVQWNKVKSDLVDNVMKIAASL